jgi:membrane protein YdbS with pleckstrin-like domain
MKELFKNIIGSLNNSPDGSSGKKLTAFFSMIFCFICPIVSWTYWAYTHNNWDLLTGILVIVSSLITAMFVTNEVGKKINNKEKKDNTDL